VLLQSSELETETRDLLQRMHGTVGQTLSWKKEVRMLGWKGIR
jgi:hypothetical protein